MSNTLQVQSDTSSIYTPASLIIGGSSSATNIGWETAIDAGTLIYGLGSPKDIVPNEPAKRVLGLTLYFKFVRSKFTKLQQEKINKAVARYSTLRFEAKELGQQGLYEELSERLLLVAREQQVLASGLDTVILKSDVERFMGKVQDKVVLMPLSQFPRVIPPDVSRKLKRVQERKLFDSYFVLFHPAAEEKPMMTSAEKIRKKDPILFGVFSNAPERLYFVADWIDEHCDLTLERLVGELKTLERDYMPGKLRLPTEKDVAALKDEVLARTKRLNETRVGNWVTQEAAAKAAEAKPKKSWWQQIVDLWR
jgi:hypothetical protein